MPIRRDATVGHLTGSARVTGGAVMLAVTFPPGSVTGSTNPTGDAGALPIGTATYTVPAGAIYVSPTGSDSGTGTVSAPYASLGKAVSAAPANATIVLRAGVYHEGSMDGSTNGVVISAQTGITVQNYPGEAVWFDGTRVVTGWVTDTTSVPGRTVWRKDSWGINFDRSPTYSRGADDQTTVGWQFVNPAYPTAPWPDQIFLDGAPLQQVAALSDVTTGAFYVAGSINGTTGSSKYKFTSTSAYIGTDPTGHEVRACDLAVCLAVVADNTTIRGIGFRRYAPSVCDFGAVKLWRANGLLENCVLQQMSTGALAAELRSGIVLRKVTIDTPGFAGVKSSNCDGIEYDRVHVINANSRNFNQAPSAAGMKMTGAQYPKIHNSIFEGGNCTGVWFDVSVLAPQVYSCDFLNNQGHGVMVEISGGTGTSTQGTVLADNLVVNSGKIGLYTMDSDACRVWNNTVTGSAEIGIDWNEDTRTPANTSYGRDGRQPYPAYYQTTMTWLPVSGASCNNIVQTGPGSSEGLFRVRSDASLDRGYENFGLTVDGNLYARPSGSPGDCYHLVNDSGTIVNYASLAAMQTVATAYGPHSREYTTAVLDANNRPTVQVAGVPLPADLAALIGQTAGTTHVGAFR